MVKFLRWVRTKVGDSFMLHKVFTTLLLTVITVKCVYKKIMCIFS